MRYPRIVAALRSSYDKLVNRINETATYLKVKRFLIWIKKHQKLTAWGTSIIMTYSLSIARKQNIALIKENNRIAVLTETLAGRNSTMNDFDWPWYKKLKRDDRFIVVGMNDAYEAYFNIDKLEALGRSNLEIAPGQVGMGWRTSDNQVLTKWSPIDILEYSQLNDSTRVPVISHKWPGRDGRDSLVYGVSVPLKIFIKVIDEEGNHEALELIPDSFNIIKKDTVIFN